MTSPLAAREMRGEEGGVKGEAGGVIDCTLEVITVTGHTCTHVFMYVHTHTHITACSVDASCVKPSATININKISVSDFGSLLIIFFFPSLHLCYITLATLA